MHDNFDQQVKDTPKKLAQSAANTYKNIKKATKAVKLAVKAIKALLIALKAVVAFLLGGGWILVVLGLFVLIIGSIVMSPATVNKELLAAQEDGSYTGKVVSFFMDVDDNWDEELDQAAIEKYKSFENKCLDGLDDFQTMQASSYALPYSLLMGIERINLFLSDDLFSSSDVWFPDPDDMYEELKTHYEWSESEINYSVQVSYSYSYSYYYEVTNWWTSTDCEGNAKEGSSVSEIHASGSDNDVVTIEFNNPVKLLKTADAFDNKYLLSYNEFTTIEDMVTGHGSYSESTGLIRESESKPDEHGSYFLANPVYSGSYSHDENDLPLKEFIETWVDDLRHNIKTNVLTIDGYPTSSFSSGSCGKDGGSWSSSSSSYISKNPYNIQFDFNYTIDSATKHYQPLSGIETEGQKFERLLLFLEDYFGHEPDLLDVETIFYVATEYDPSFAYNYSVNDGSLFFSGFFNNQIFYDGSLGALTWPVSDTGSRISSYFGPRGAIRNAQGRIVSSAGFHGGIDIASGGRMIPIYSTADGVVAFSGSNGGYGNTVIIDHGLNNEGRRFMTLYAHLASIGVKNGQPVTIGEQIGIMGSTGASTGIHLHYEIRINNSRENPLKYYQKEAYQDYA